MRELIAMTSADVITSAAAELPDADVLEELYLSAPVSTGLLCLRHILSKPNKRPMSSSTNYATEPTSPNLPPNDHRRFGKHHRRSADRHRITMPANGTIHFWLRRSFVAAAFAAPATTWSQPVETQFGWHVISIDHGQRSEAMSSPLRSPDGPLFYVDAVLNSADVTVDSRYGRWDPASGRIVPLDDTSRNVADIAAPTITVVGLGPGSPLLITEHTKRPSPSRRLVFTNGATPECVSCTECDNLRRHRHSRSVQ